MEFIIASILAPVPIIHFWFHSILYFWRKKPYLFYVWGVTIWVGSFFVFRYIDPISPRILFYHVSSYFLYAGILLRLCGALMVLSSIYTLGIKRFFLWCALKPNDTDCSVVRRKGPFEFVPHPAYAGYMLLLLGNFLSSGKVYLLVSFVFLFTFLPLIIMLEDQELSERARTHTSHVDNR